MFLCSAAIGRSGCVNFSRYDTGGEKGNGFNGIIEMVSGTYWSFNPSEILMSNWPVQDANARFSELLETCLREGPQTVTRHGHPEAVLVSAKEWEAASRGKTADLKSWLLAPIARGDLLIPPRGKAKSRFRPSS
jgi:prevent-host-death family protein